MKKKKRDDDEDGKMMENVEWKKLRSSWKESKKF